MKTNFSRLAGMALTLFVISIPTGAQTARKKPDPCKATSNMSQRQMNDCAANDLRKTELKLQKLLTRLGISSNDPSQKAWEVYRDAQLEAIYPKGDSATFGSVFPMCFSILKKKLTEGHIKDLEALITKEGDSCYGYHLSSGTKN